MKKLAVTLAMAGASILSVGTAVMVPTAAQAQPAHARVAPPPPRHEAVPPPRRGYVWAPGHYEWKGHRYVWQKGVWMRDRPGYAYRSPQWQEHDGHCEGQQ